MFPKVLSGGDTAAAACSGNCRENPLLEFLHPVGNEEGQD